MKQIYSWINKRRWTQVVFIVFAASALSLAVLNIVRASVSAVENKKVVSVEFGDDVDLSVGRAGVYIPESKVQGTLVMTRIDRDRQSKKFTWFQQELEVFIYEGEEGSRTIGKMFGIAYVYFNLDVTARRAYDQVGGDTMSIWYWHSYFNDWVKCPTFLVRDASAPRGRLACIWQEFGLYALGYRHAEFINELVKLGLITKTPTPTPTFTPTP
jgi:hypothetical protein